MMSLEGVSATAFYSFRILSWKLSFWQDGPRRNPNASNDNHDDDDARGLQQREGLRRRFRG